MAQRRESGASRARALDDQPEAQPPGATTLAHDPSAETADLHEGTATMAREAVLPGEGAPVPSQIAGRYQVLDEIGRGGMGTVYRAFDIRLVRHVALKLVVSSESRRARLLREAQALAQLAHPNVVPVYDVGIAGDMVFMAMELIDGVDLRRWLATGRRSQREIVRVFAAAGEGLVAAHAAGLVHRDFKPANVLIGADGRVRVLDFGLARAIASEADSSLSLASSPSLAPSRSPARMPASPARRDDRAHPSAASQGSSQAGSELGSPLLESSLTQHGDVVGTPRYMAPEQRRADATGARTDQYSFCLTLYEALYGEPPFASREARRSFNESGRPAIDPPARRGVPARLRRVLRRGLRWNPEDRFASMAEVVAHLRRELRVIPTGIAVAATAGVAIAASVAAVAVARQEPEPCGGAAERAVTVWPSTLRDQVVRALVGTGSPHAPWVASRLTAQVDGYLRTWSEQRTQVCRATRVHGEQPELVMDCKLACLDDNLDQVAAFLRALAGAATEAAMNRAGSELDRVSSLALCDDAEALARRDEVPVRPDEAPIAVALRGGIRELNALNAVGNADAAEPVARRVHDLAGRITHAETRAEALHAYASALRWRGIPALEATAWDEALRAASESDNRTLIAEAWGNLLYITAVEERRNAATEELLRATEVALLQARDEPDHARLVGNVGHMIATSEMDLGRLEDAETRFRKLLTLPQHAARRSASFNNLGLVLLYRGRFDEARASLAASRRIDEATFGDTHPYFGDDALNLGLTYHWEGDVVTAERWYRKALDHSIRNQGPSSKNALFHLYLGHVLLDRGAWAEAGRELDLAVDGFVAAVGTDAELTRHTRLQRARLRLEQGDLAGARAELDEAKAARARAGDVDRLVPGYMDPFVLEGRVLVAEGKPAAARSLLDLALVRYQRLYGEGLPVTEPLLALGELALASGRPRDAIGLADRVLELLQRGRSHDHDPRRAEVLFLRARARKAAGAAREAVEAVGSDARMALAVWRVAGPGHPRVAEVERFLAARR